MQYREKERDKGKGNKEHRQCKEHKWRKVVSRFVMEAGDKVFSFSKIPLYRCERCKEIWIPEDTLRVCLKFIKEKVSDIRERERVYYCVDFDFLLGKKEEKKIEEKMKEIKMDNYLPEEKMQEEDLIEEEFV